MPHRFVTVIAEPHLTHPTEDGLATSVAMVSRDERVYSEIVSFVGGDTILDEVNFAGVITD
jgi:hypothetical protein